jgi:hypothetical protein
MTSQFEVRDLTEDEQVGLKSTVQKRFPINSFQGEWFTGLIKVQLKTGESET